MFLQTISRSIASGFGSGFSPLLSGTAGSAALIVVWYLTFGLGWYTDQTFWLTTCALTVVGLLATRFAIQDISSVDNSGQHTKVDPGFVVIDEWVGMLIALFGIAPNEIVKIVVAFVLFRAFDIVKPGPVRWLERLPREWGIMCDDIAAGFLALFVRMLCGI